LEGLYRTSEEDWLSNIELGKCCKPDSLPNQYGKCIDKAITTSFDNKVKASVAVMMDTIWLDFTRDHATDFIA